MHRLLIGGLCEWLGAPAMHCETQQHGLPRLLTEAQTLDAPMTEARIRRAMNLPSQSRRVNISNASPLWVSEMDGITFFPARPLRWSSRWS
jgi:hypothetical protein